MCMVERVGKEVFLLAHSALLYSAKYGFAVGGVDYYGIVAAPGYGAAKFPVCLGLACAHLNKSRGDDDALVAIAHGEAEVDHPARQGLMGIMEVFLDTMVICTLTALTLLCGAADKIVWGQDAGAELISASFSSVFGAQVGSMLVAVGISLFALSTILSWSLYGSRCCEFLLGSTAARIRSSMFTRHPSLCFQVPQISMYLRPA